jgi:hypothetical protein
MSTNTIVARNDSATEQSSDIKASSRTSDRSGGRPLSLTNWLPAPRADATSTPMLTPAFGLNCRKFTSTAIRVYPAIKAPKNVKIGRKKLTDGVGMSSPCNLRCGLFTFVKNLGLAQFVAIAPNAVVSCGTATIQQLCGLANGWGARIRTSEWRNQNPLPYHLATPQRVSGA